MALGPLRRSVDRLVLGESAWFIGTGTGRGVIGAVTDATLMHHLLCDVQSWDPPTLQPLLRSLRFGALLASYLPARRAASVNPIEVLRAE